MAFSATALKVMIASPGDVADARNAARQIVHDWNAIHSEDRGIVLLPVAWETNAAPAMGERAQEIINKQLLRGCDLLIAIFWTRVGTPTGTAPGGTIEEIEEHIGAGKPAMVYFSAEPVRLDSVDEEQYRALQQVRERFRKMGLVEQYESLEQFREKLTRQLAQTVIRHFPRGSAAPSVPKAGSTPDAFRLSADAATLLREAVADPNGTVLMLETFGGLSVETNGRNFVAEGDRRSEARWRDAVNELVKYGFLERRDPLGEVTSVTSGGYEAADWLARGPA